MNRGESSQTDDVVQVHRENGSGGVVLVCEHASNRIPPQYNGLGLKPGEDMLHIAWDPGAADVAHMVSAALDCPLIECGVSRLVYDCNRPPDAIDAIPARSEVYDIPGNADLEATARAARVAAVYVPFSTRLSQLIRDTRPVEALVTIHTFTPVYNGQHRQVEIGILHGTDTRLAQTMMSISSKFSDHIVRLNEPYSMKDGVAHTMNVHGVENGIPNVMIEVRNDLVASPKMRTSVASLLSAWIRDAVARTHSEATQ